MNIPQRLRWLLQTAYICHSLDGEMYYILWGNRRPRHWLSVAVYPGPVPDERKRDALVGWRQINKADGTVYHRKALDFVWFDVKSAGDEQPINKQSSLFQDYVGSERWEL